MNPVEKLFPSASHSKLKRSIEALECHIDATLALMAAHHHTKRCYMEKLFYSLINVRATFFADPNVSTWELDKCWSRYLRYCQSTSTIFSIFIGLICGGGFLIMTWNNYQMASSSHTFRGGSIASSCFGDLDRNVWQILTSLSSVHPVLYRAQWKHQQAASLYPSKECSKHYSLSSLIFQRKDNENRLWNLEWVR